MPVQLLSLCDNCLELVKDSFNARYSQQSEKGVCEMCKKERHVRKVRIDGGKDKKQSDHSVPESGVS